MPWQASAADFALHPLASVAPPAHPYPPAGLPPLAYHFTDEAVHGDWTAPAPPNATRAARRAYRAALAPS